MSPASLWSVLSLSEAFWFQEGPGVRKWQFTKSGIKLLNVGNIEKDGTLNLAKTDRYLDEAEVAEKYSHFLIDEGDLVIASSGISFDDDGLLRTRGTFIDSSHLPLCLNTSTIRFKAVEGMSDLRFLRFWLNTYEFRSQITKLVTGSAQQNFGPSHLKALKITLPPLEKQKRIADILDRAEALRTKRRVALSQLDELTQSIFLDMFGNPATNPKGWPIIPMAALFAESPIFGTMIPPSVDNGKWLSLRVANIQEWQLDLTDKKYVDLPEKMVRRHSVMDGDLLMARAIASQEHLGKSVIVYPQERKWAFDSHLMRLRFDKTKAESEFIRCLLMTPGGRSLFLKASRRSAVQFNINTKEISELQIPVPSIPLQQEFTRRIEDVKKLKKAHKTSLAELDELFASLQYRAFRGELSTIPEINEQSFEGVKI